MMVPDIKPSDPRTVSSPILYETATDHVDPDQSIYWIAHLDHQAVAEYVLCFKEKPKMRLHPKYRSPRSRQLYGMSNVKQQKLPKSMADFFGSRPAQAPSPSSNVVPPPPGPPPNVPDDPNNFFFAFEQFQQSQRLRQQQQQQQQQQGQADEQQQFESL